MKYGSNLDLDFIQCKEYKGGFRQCWCIDVTYVDVVFGGTGVWKNFECGRSLFVRCKSIIAGLYLKCHQ